MINRMVETNYAWTSQNVPPLSAHILIDLSGMFLLAIGTWGRIRSRRQVK